MYVCIYNQSIIYYTIAKNCNESEDVRRNKGFHFIAVLKSMQQLLHCHFSVPF